MDPFTKLYKTKPLRQENLEYKGRDYIINYMSEDLMKAAQVRGIARKGQVYLDGSLEGRVKRFVTAHEIYHLRDKQTWLGYFGAEFRANFMCGLKDPLGLLATINKFLRSGNTSHYFVRMLKNNATLIK